MRDNNGRNHQDKGVAGAGQFAEDSKTGIAPTDLLTSTEGQSATTPPPPDRVAALFPKPVLAIEAIASTEPGPDGTVILTATEAAPMSVAAVSLMRIINASRFTSTTISDVTGTLKPRTNTDDDDGMSDADVIDAFGDSFRANRYPSQARETCVECDSDDIDTEDDVRCATCAQHDMRVIEFSPRPNADIPAAAKAWSEALRARTALMDQGGDDPGVRLDHDAFVDLHAAATAYVRIYQECGFFADAHIPGDRMGDTFAHYIQRLNLSDERNQ